MAGLLELLLPPACAGCDAVGRHLCDACARSFRPPSRPDDAFVAPDAGVVVGSELVLAVAAFAYAGPARRALARLKYAGAARVSRSLAALAGPALDRLLAASGGAPLVPVPVHGERLRTRGYNQAFLLARELARPRGLAVAELLARRHATERQHRLDRAARLRNLRDAVSVVPGAPVPPVAIVVDDILTTSATLEACALVLHAAGVAEVYGFAIAREV
jgi:ComF family protein